MPLPPNHPAMLAWEEFKLTENYAHARRWVNHPEHTDASLWGMFIAGYLAHEQETSPQ